MVIDKRVWPLYFLVVTALACVTNTSISRVPPPPPTRTPIPTFTNTPTPLPPTPVPTGTNTPAPVRDTPTPVPQAEAVEAALEAEATPTETPPPTPTQTLPPPTNTPRPTAAPVTNPQPPPPTAPPPSPTAVSNSPVATPTATPELGTPPGRYEALELDAENNCADIGVYGWVRDKGSDQPIPHVMVEVTREDDDDDDDEDDVRGPWSAKTNEDGRYDIHIGPIDDVGEMELKARVVGGPGVDSEDEPEWEVSSDCHDDDEIQVREINWGYKN